MRHQQNTSKTNAAVACVAGGYAAALVLQLTHGLPRPEDEHFMRRLLAALVDAMMRQFH